MMKTATPEQIDFIRRHGITRCPPGPQPRMSWGAKPKRRGFSEKSEEDMLADMTGVVFYHFSAIFMPRSSR